jgi:hypothetical protein
LSVLLIFSKSQLFVSLILCSLFGFDFINLGPDLCYFFPFAGLWFVLVFLGAYSASLDCLVERSLFFECRHL